MEPCYTFDPERYFLGEPCKHGHLFPGTSQSLRVPVVVPVDKNGYGPYEGSNCLACKLGKFRGQDWRYRHIDLSAMGFTDRHSLGRLCSKGHNWENTGLSLRRNGHCVECDKERERRGGVDPAKRREYYQRYKESHPERIKEANRRAGLRPETKARKSAYRKKRRELLRQQGLGERGVLVRPSLSKPHLTPEERQTKLDASAKRRAERQALLAQRKAERETPEYKEQQRAKRLLEYQLNEDLRTYHREKSKRRKATMKARHAVRVRARDIRVRFATFGNCCAYCGEGGDMHMDHFVPLARGGTHTLGNLLPACGRCNLSKRDHDAEAWYKQQPYFSRSRWKKLREVLGIKKGPVTQLTLL